MPITVISTRGSVVHMRPLPSDSTTTTVPVSATPKFAPETATGTDRNFSRRCAARRLGDRRRLVAEVLASAIVRSNSVPDLRAVPVDRGHEDVRLLVVRELDDQLRQVGLDRLDALAPRAPR